jgi:hypothetical protein
MVRTALLMFFCLISSSFLVSCSDDTRVAFDDEANAVEDDDPVCSNDCPGGTNRVADSATRCGFRCDRIVEDGADAVAECDRPCPDGFEVVLAPQTECGFTCLPEPIEDGSSFVDAETTEDVGEEDAAPADVPDEDSD